MVKRLLLAILSVLLVAGSASAATYEMLALGDRAGYRLAITSSVTTSDFIVAPARANNLISLTQGSDFTATVYACETKEYAVATCGTAKTTLTTSTDEELVTTAKGWLVFDVTAAETGSNVSYLSIASNPTNAGIGTGGGSGDVEGLTNPLVADLDADDYDIVDAGSITIGGGSKRLDYDTSAACFFVDKNGDGAMTNGRDVDSPDPTVVEHCVQAHEVWMSEFDVDSTTHGLQEAIDTVCDAVAADDTSNRGGIIHVPVGVYDFTDTATHDINIPTRCHGIQIVGEGNGSRFGGTYPATGTQFKVSLAGGVTWFTTAADVDGWKLDNLLIEITAEASGSKLIAVGDSNANFEISNLYTLSSGTASSDGTVLYMDDPQSCRIHGNRLEGLGTSIEHAGTSGAGGCAYYDNPGITPGAGTGTGTGILFSGAYPCSDVTIERNAFHAGNIGIDGTSTTNTCHARIDRNYFELTGTAGNIDIRAAGAFGVTVIENLLNNVPGGSPAKAFSRTSVTGSTLVDIFIGNDHRGDIEMSAGRCIVDSVVVGTGSTSACASQRLSGLTAFPASPVSGMTVVITDDSASGACDSSAGSSRSLCWYNGSGWVSLGGSSSGTTIQFGGNAIADASGGNITVSSGKGLAIDFDSAPSPDTGTIRLDYVNTLAANSLNGEECVFSTSGTGGGGLLCEGSTANSFDHLHLFETTDTADTSDFIATSNTAVTDALGLADAIASFQGIDSDLTDLADGQLSGASTVGDSALAAGAVDGGTGGEIADDSITGADIAADAIGASEIDESMALTVESITTAATTTPTMNLLDSDSPDDTDDDNAAGIIKADMTDATSDSTDSKIEMSVQVADTPTEILQLDVNGAAVVGTVYTTVGLDATGAVDMDYGSADVTDHTFVTDGTGDAEFVVPDQSISSTEILNATIVDADMANNGLDPDKLVGDSTDNDLIDEGLIPDSASVSSWNLTTPTITTSANFGAAGVTVSDDGDGAITILGIGDGTSDFDESLTLNFMDTTNTVAITSATSVSTIALSGMNADHTIGYVRGSKPVATSSGGTITYNAIVVATAASSTSNDYDVPDQCDSASGAWFKIFVRDASEQISIAFIDTGDAFVLTGGSALTAGNEVDSAASAQGQFIEFTCLEANKWYQTDSSGTWTDGGTAD